MTQGITLTGDQQNALDAFIQFMGDPAQSIFVLQGYAGCGKSTLVKTIIERLPDIQKTIRLIDPGYVPYDLNLTATTNKAAETLSQVTGHGVQTTHSALGMYVVMDYSSRESILKRRDPRQLHRELLVIDEASFVDQDLLRAILQSVHDCKILFIGDPAQLTPFKKSAAHNIFSGKFPGAVLTQVVRQAGDSPIIDLTMMLRNTVITGNWGQVVPDDVEIIHRDRNDFLQALEQEFSRLDWEYHDSKVLAWTNKTVQQFNQHIHSVVQGSPTPRPGDYVICNSYVSSGNLSIKTDSTVLISGISGETEFYGLRGHWYDLAGQGVWFMPNSLEEKNAAIRLATKEGLYHVAHMMESSFIDLRAAYAQTVNKSQGSTYEKVFIDLDDIAKCRNPDQMARMLYVAVSRAKSQVTFTGDIK